MTMHPYEPLAKDVFRLLTIINRQDPVIQCTLSAFSLDRPPAYSALSYTWGSAVPADGLTPDLNRTLVCNGGEAPITASLEHALRSVPLAYECIWADAVCINQQDVDERSAQVALMGRIYSQASQVVVWLGPADDFTQTAFDFIRDFAGRMPDEVYHFNAVQSKPFFSDSGFWGKIGRPEWSAAEKHALVWLFIRNWFSRAWVIQEVVFASDAVVFCGSHSAPWQAFSVVSAFFTQRDLTRIAMEEVDGAREYLAMRGGYFRAIGSVPNNIELLKEQCVNATSGISEDNRDYESAMVLERIIWSTRNVQATEPKDKVFAPIALLLHLLPSEELTARLKPDYSKSVAEVFIEVSSYLMQHCDKPGRAFMLSLVGDTTQSQVAGLPSWVPDYSAHTPSNIAAQFDRKFNCIAGLDLDKYLEFTPRKSKLRIWASQFDTVLVLLPPLFQKGRGSVAELLPWLHFAAALPDFDASGEPAILSMIHSFTANGTREYDCRAVYDKFRDMLTKVFCLLVSRSQISVDQLLAPVLSGLLDDLERRRITAFPTCAQLRDAVKDPGAAMEPEDEVFRFMKNTDRRLFQSTQGYLGIMPTAAQTGDEIFFVPGSTVPFVFRKTKQSGEYELVGEAYVHGIMYGELWREGLQPQWLSVTLL
ncbi:heterokaryon incompatibility protein-domain-containing protein [Diaporthe amygdali]|uniref:heterokaryon incompatibility protein-domain-containing protein n=1 Tax=Phomopsis amygdali TaxID=1214568 RepID=UPI0022FF24B1|nr:heterokaryon incompatibility protein-domain-containing protein [Diaporthe amygdali]KAJ0109503.1 heterokaryon incompatibility protein-domain-containing protein [Diaporthe amygdali]